MSKATELAGHRDKVVRYYNRTESLVGYKYLMGETKHFGWYEPEARGVPFGPALRRMEHKLAVALSVGPGDRVLDAGSGMGVVACEVASRTGCNVTGVDILDFNVRRANERARELGISDDVVFEEMDYSSLDFADESFDAVYTCETLVHAADPALVLSEFRRVLKPGGRLVMLEYSREEVEAMPARANEAFRKVNELAAMPAFQNEFFHGVLSSMVTEQGFASVHEDDLTRNILPMLRVFRTMATLPLKLFRVMGKEAKVVNAMSAVEFYKYRQFFKYIMVIAVKTE